MFRRPGSIKLLDIAGIRIGVDGTWFVMLFVLIFWLSGSFRSALHSSDGVAYLTTVATVLLFFVSLILHELGHAVAARRRGIGVTRIDLFLFGGFTRMSRDTRTPGEELEVAAAGPAGTLMFCLVCLAVDFALVGGHRLVHAIELDGTVPLTPVLLALSFLLPMNMLILVFNLIPAYPLDGGRIARAIVWRVTGDRAPRHPRGGEDRRGAGGRAGGPRHLAAAEGSRLRGHLAAGAGVPGRPVRSRGTAPVGRHRACPGRAGGRRDGPSADRGPVRDPGQPGARRVLSALRRRLAAGRRRRRQVHRESRGGTGCRRSTDGGEGWLPISSVLESDDADTLRIGEDRPLTDVLTLESLGRLGAVMAVDGEGVLRGVVTLDRVRRALQTVFATPLR